MGHLFALFCFYGHSHTGACGATCLFSCSSKTSCCLPVLVQACVDEVIVSVLAEQNREYCAPHLSAHILNDRRIIMNQMTVNGPQTACLIWVSSSPQALCVLQ